MTADHELFAALQADEVDEHRDEVKRLRQLLQDTVLEVGGFVQGEDGRWRQELGPLVFFGALTPTRAVEILNDAGLVFRLVPDRPAGAA